MGANNRTYSLCGSKGMLNIDVCGRILVIMPLSALLVLFDFVVHNPNHPETSNSLALLDIAGGHFSRLEFVSKATLPASLISEFAHIARQYVSDMQILKGQPARDPAATRENFGVPTQYQMPSVQHSQRPGSTPTRVSSGLTVSSSREELLPTRRPLCEPVNTQTSKVQYENSGTVLDQQDDIFFPLVDDPSYRLEDLQLLGVDLMNLFDTTYPTGAESEYGNMYGLK
jgi:hypothetical protein